MSKLQEKKQHLGKEKKLNTSHQSTQKTTARIDGERGREGWTQQNRRAAHSTRPKIPTLRRKSATHFEPKKQRNVTQKPAVYPTRDNGSKRKRLSSSFLFNGKKKTCRTDAAKEKTTSFATKIIKSINTNQHNSRLSPADPLSTPGSR